TVKDKNGMIISFINSLFDQFGSSITVPKTGILLHCRGKSFSLKAGHPNQIYPRKRPLHTIIPGMIGQNQNIVGSFGVMGGHYQAAGHAFILSQILDFCLSPQCALDLPRIYPNNGTLDIEGNFDLDLIEELKNKGHKVNYPALPIGGGQIIINDIDNGISIGASDWRKDGIALGL
ncbi:MAG: gamma-glutamyltransferase, partial [Alphaproteobacteria bacterium TMED54]